MPFFRSFSLDRSLSASMFRKQFCYYARTWMRRVLSTQMTFNFRGLGKEGNGLGCGQPWITLGKTHWQNKSGSGLRESLGYVWLRGYEHGSIAAWDTWQLPRKASWGDPEIFQMFVRPTTNRNIQKSRHAVTWLQTKLLIGCMSIDMPDMWH